MADTLRERILLAVSEILMAIKIDNGYNTNAGLNVLRVPPSVNEDDLPSIVITDGSETSNLKYGMHILRFRLLVSLFIKRTDISGSSQQVNAILGDIIKCLIGGDVTYGGLANNTTYVQSVPTFPESGGDVVVIRVDFEIEYEYEFGNPYGV